MVHVILGKNTQQNIINFQIEIPASYKLIFCDTFASSEFGNSNGDLDIKIILHELFEAVESPQV